MPGIYWAYNQIQGHGGEGAQNKNVDFLMLLKSQVSDITINIIIILPLAKLLILSWWKNF